MCNVDKLTNFEIYGYPKLWDRTKKMAFSQTRRHFTHSCIPDFLQSGWVLSLANGKAVIGWGSSQWREDLGEEECGVFAPDFYLSAPRPWLVSEHWDEVSRTDLLTTLIPQTKTATANQTDSGAATDSVTWREPSFSNFESIFFYLKSEMEWRKLRKAVPAVYAQADLALTQETLFSILKNILHLPEHLRLYGFWNLEIQEAFIGATPEVLFSYDKEKLKTMALAGTLPLPASKREREAFFEDSKERTEHQLVIEDIEAVLKDFGSVQTGETKIFELPHLLHLKTEFEVELKTEFHFQKTTQALHPTPALGFSPRIMGLNWMKSWDRLDLRGRFGAPFGVYHKTSIAECLVAIRGVQITQGKAVLGSGCGVVEQSEPAREWNELSAKRASVRKMLGL